MLGRLLQAPLRDHAGWRAGLHYLCAGYKKFFRHIRKYPRAMGTFLENDLPVSAVMRAIDAPLIITTERPDRR